MSVTSQLKNPNSALSNFFNRVEKPNGIARFVYEKNKILAQINPMVVDNVMPAFVGTAFSYYLRWEMQPMAYQIYTTVAGLAIYRRKIEDVTTFFSDVIKTPYNKAAICCLLALFEQEARTGAKEMVIDALITKDRKLLPGRADPSAIDDSFSNSILDVQMLGETIESVFSGNEIVKSGYISSPSFAGSEDVGGADAVMIVDGVLFDVRCTRKRRPMTPNNLRQMVSYVLLDYYNEHNIKACAWYYARQKTMIIVPVEKIISDLDAKRNILQEYMYDNNLAQLDNRIMQLLPAPPEDIEYIKGLQS
jgi:hypothetical protein